MRTGGGDYLLVVKDNQPALLSDIQEAFSPWGLGPEPTESAWKAPPWLLGELVSGGGRLDVVVREPKGRHGWREVRRLWALADGEVNGYAGSSGEWARPWPHRRQVCRFERERLLVRRGQVLKMESEVGYAITSAPAERADAATLLQNLRGHWLIENGSHWVRDVTFDEDRCQIRSGAAPQVVAACRNLVIALLRRRPGGCPNVAAALRTYAARPRVAVTLVLSTGTLC